VHIYLSTILPKNLHRDILLAVYHKAAKTGKPLFDRERAI